MADNKDKNIRLNRSVVDRSNQIRRDNDTIQEASLGLYDIDETIKYYFDNIVSLQITNSSGVLESVPVAYASPENWKSFQSSDLKRDSRGKIQLPFLVFKRDSITKDRNLGNKVDPGQPLYVTIEEKYNSRNRYDRFSVLNKQLQGRKPIRTLQKMVVPDYVTITYSCIIYTEFLTQMNTLIEAISYGEGSYWGDKNKYMVRAKIDEFPSAIELAVGEDRVVKSEFQITLNGFIIPKTVQKLAAIDSVKTFTKAIVELGENLVTDVNGDPDSLGEDPAPTSGSTG